MELTKLSLTELRRLQTKIDTEIKRRSDTARKNLLKQIKKLAAEEGLSLDDVIGAEGGTVAAAPAKQRKRGKKGGKSAAAVAMKYRNPENSAMEWSGRGRRPQWVLDWLEQGNQLDALEI